MLRVKLCPIHSPIWMSDDTFPQQHSSTKPHSNNNQINISTSLCQTAHKYLFVAGADFHIEQLLHSIMYRRSAMMVSRKQTCGSKTELWMCLRHSHGPSHVMKVPMEDMFPFGFKFGEHHKGVTCEDWILRLPLWGNLGDAPRHSSASAYTSHIKMKIKSFVLLYHHTNEAI